MEHRIEVRQMFDESFKRMVIEEYLTTKCDKMELLRKYNIHFKSAIQTWMRKSDEFHNSAFEYFFLDDHFNSQYKNDVQFASMFGVFTILAIIISSLGLLGLGIFSVSQRIKEIGIRRVLGSSISGILFLFSKDSFWLLVIAYGISLPVIILGISNWLDNFAFHVGYEWPMFVFPPMLLLVISLVTIIFVTLKSATTSPAVSLKAE